MSASTWAPGTSISANSSIQSEAFVATAAQTLFTLTNFEYVRNNGTLYVYVAGKLQRPGVDVYETSTSSFTLSTGAPEGAIVLAVAFTEVSLVVPLTSASQELFTATGGQTVFNLTSNYNPGGDTLAIYVNGLRLFPSDYVETSTNVFTLNTGLTAGDQVLAITKEDLMISDPVNIAAGTINGTQIGNTNPSTGAFTTLDASGALTLSGGTANGVLYLNGSKVATSGSALTFDGASLGVGATPSYKIDVNSGGVGVVARFTGGTQPAFIYSSNSTAWFAAEAGVLNAIGVSAATSSVSIYADSAQRAEFNSAGLAVTGVIEGAEQTAPAAPAANGYRIFAQDNGAGKTQLMVVFQSGAAQQIAIEP